MRAERCLSSSEAQITDYVSEHALNLIVATLQRLIMKADRYLSLSEAQITDYVSDAL